MKFFLTTLALVCISITYSQKIELGKVTLEELNEKNHVSDTSAVAAYLFKKGEVKFNYSQSEGFIISTNVKLKIKIYKKEGYDWANFSVPFSTGQYGQTVDVKNAATYNIVAGKIEKTKLKSDGEFEEKVNKYWSRKKITMPNVKEGSIIELEYEIKDKGIGSIDEWYFQSSIPINYCEYSTYIPEYFEYNTYWKGFLAPTVTKEVLNESIISTYKDRNYVTPTQFSNEKTEYRVNKTKYVLKDVSSIKDESFVNNIRNYTSSISQELSLLRYPNSPVKTFSTDWETIVKNIYEYDDFGPELNKSGYYDNDLNVLLKDITAQPEKAAIIFNYVKSRMNWNGMNGYGCENGVRKAYLEKTGNVADINLMLVSMLRYAGIEANPILVSTRNNGISLFPSSSAFNYVIAGIELDNQVVMLDATDKNALPNILPIRDLNWFGRIVRKNGSSAEINLMPASNSKENINMLATISDSGEVSGKIRDQYFDYNAFIFRDNYGSLSKESMTEKIEKNHKEIEVSEYDYQNLKDLSKPIIESYAFNSNNEVEIIGDKMYFSPFLFLSMDENPFKQETREYPVDFIFPHQDKYMISVTIPDGYNFETLPQSKAIKFPDNSMQFSYLISTSGKTVQLIYSLEVNQSIVSPENYAALKELFKEIVNKHTEKIVLKKA
ncbi:hypothetical protein GCM10011508_10410 [Flavobacterium lutivivi]|nr:hypothetical protein GCM10011508_10410 [Flavobacterium lutivivi]